VTAPAVDRAVLAWARWYTRDLPDAIGADRLAELESDLFEERAAADGAPGVGRSILGRAVRGIPADIAWRLAGLRQTSLGAPRGTFPLALPGFAHLATALLLAWGVLVVTRIAALLVSGEWSGAWDLVAAGVVGLAMAFIGAALTMTSRLRWLGALWLAVASYLLIRFGMYGLIATSITLTEFHDSSIRSAILMNRSLTAGGVLFFVAMAVWWLPAAAPLWRSRAQRADATATSIPITEGGAA
jgi:hypothetical protein